MDEAQYLADRAAVIAAGQIVAEGPPATLGDRNLGRARIRYRRPDGALPPDGLTGSADPDGFTTIESADPIRDLHRLTGWAIENDVTLDGLEVTRPTLEDVYLTLTSETRAGESGASTSRTRA
jgi:ABC-2 type transport system ATP-binding protein